ncbi:response regulator [Jeotgalibacillus sp. JSM ZJ347]|uniref:response regulator transcription factor n=1 Tax=Jeotgalibacillus sp. JSM ZJ347 TaxID=3342117 RepID=UPI0035A87FFF
MIHVMIADDEPLILKNLQGIIDWESLGCQVVATAGNGLDALEILRSKRIDLLLTDISMPGMTGVEVLKEIYTWEDRPLAILLSGYDEFTYAREGLKYSALDYFLKPIDYEELETCIEGAVKTIHQHRREAYDRERQRIYDQVVTGAESAFESDFYAALMIRHGEGKVDQWLQQLPHQLYVYVLDSNLTLALIKGTEREAVEQVAHQLASDGSQHFKETRWIVADAETGPGAARKAADEAKRLLKYTSLTDAPVITAALVTDTYAAKENAFETIDKATAYVKEHFKEDLSIEEVAEHAGISVSYFSQLFKQKHQITFLEYVRAERIEHACMLLKTSTLETYRIAEIVGYTDQRYFSQVFRKHMNMTPSQYRKAHSG